MPRLPAADRAVLDIRKLADYCLSPTHPRGRHKARVFREALGLGLGDALWLREVLLHGVMLAEATELTNDEFGRRWRADVSVTRHGMTAVVRTIWIVRSGEEVPRFVTCWVL